MSVRSFCGVNCRLTFLLPCIWVRFGQTLAAIALALSCFCDVCGPSHCGLNFTREGVLRVADVFNATGGTSCVRHKLAALAPGRGCVLARAPLGRGDNCSSQTLCLGYPSTLGTLEPCRYPRLPRSLLSAGELMTTISKLNNI